MKDLIKAGIEFLDTALNVIILGENPEIDSKDPELNKKYANNNKIRIFRIK